MKRTAFSVSILSLFFAVAVLGPPCAAQTKTGDILAGTAYSYSSAYLRSDVPVSVHLPRDYDRSDARYPVLYMLDFGNDFAFAGPVADFLEAAHRVPGLIVVAVAVDKLSGPPQAMLDFLEKELFPSVEKSYRTRPCRLLYGHSGRSFAALFVMLNRPDLFYAAICPGLGLMDPPMPGAVNFPALASAKLAGLSSFPKALYFSLGDEKPFLGGVGKLMEVFRTKAPRDFEWKFAPMESDDHYSTKLKTLYDGLEFAFGGMNLPLDVAEKGVAAVKDHYDKLGRRLGFPLVLSEPPLAQMIDDAIVRIAAYQKRVGPALDLLEGMKKTMGYPGISESSYGLIGSFSLNAGSAEDAAAVYEAMTAAYPGSASAWNGLGEAHEKLGRLDLAVKDFESACELGRKSVSPRLAAFESNLARVRKALRPRH